MIALRPYQRAAFKSLTAAFMRTPRVLLQSPTGSGKTVIGASFAALAPCRRVLWIAHRVELLTQARTALLAAGVPRVGILCGGDERVDVGAPVLVAMINSLGRGSHDDFDLVVIDEAHRVAAASYQRVLTQYPTAFVLGLTATPERLDGKGLGETFGALVLGPQQRELAGKYLARPEMYTVPGSKVREAIAGVKIARGDYEPVPLARAMMHDDLVAEVVEHVAGRAPGARTIVFAVSREHGKKLCKAFVASGRRAGFVDGETPEKERAKLIAALKSGALEVLVNVDVLTEGFDAPEVTCVVMARPTQSLVRYLQFAGRAARPYGDAPAIILDHAGNFHAHGMVDEDREWSLDGRPKSDGAPRAKACTFCGAVMALGATTCPVCGLDAPVNPREQWERDATAVELERVASLAARTVTCKHAGCAQMFTVKLSNVGHTTRCPAHRRSTRRVTATCKHAGCAQMFTVRPSNVGHTTRCPAHRLSARERVTVTCAHAGCATVFTVKPSDVGGITRCPAHRLSARERVTVTCAHAGCAETIAVVPSRVGKITRCPAHRLVKGARVTVTCAHAGCAETIAVVPSAIRAIGSITRCPAHRLVKGACVTVTCKHAGCAQMFTVKPAQVGAITRCPAHRRGSTRVTVTCAHAGCAATIAVRPSEVGRVTKCPAHRRAHRRAHRLSARERVTVTCAHAGCAETIAVLPSRVGKITRCPAHQTRARQRVTVTCATAGCAQTFAVKPSQVGRVTKCPAHRQVHSANDARVTVTCAHAGCAETIAVWPSRVGKITRCPAHRRTNVSRETFRGET